MATVALLMLAVLVSGCGDDPEPPSPQYGVPHIFYQVKGIVTDETGTPLTGVAVKLKDDYGRFYMPLDSVVTDTEGAYATQVVEDANIHKGLVVIAEDVDGEANGGHFATDTLSLVDLNRRQVKVGDDDWDSGQWEVTGNFRLKKQ